MFCFGVNHIYVSAVVLVIFKGSTNQSMVPWLGLMNWATSIMKTTDFSLAVIVGWITIKILGQRNGISMPVKLHQNGLLLCYFDCFIKKTPLPYCNGALK